MKLKTGVLAICATGLFACGSESMENPSDPNNPNNPSDPNDPTQHALTFHKDIEPILQANCQNCHRPEGIAPLSFMTYEETKDWAGLIKLKTERREMPPWGALDTDECKPRFGWKEDLRLSQEELDILADWADDGAPEGDIADAPQKVQFVDNRLSDPTHVLPTQSSFVTEGPRDEFICFVLDPGWTEDGFVTGAHFLPGNSNVVHHSVVFTDPNRESLDLANDQGFYPCFGGPGVSDTALLHAWAPGGVPTEIDNAGIQVSAGTLIVMQIHYHPDTDGGQEPDQSSLELRFTTENPKHILVLALIGNFDSEDENGDGLLPGMNDSGPEPEFRIPAGAKAHVENQQFTLPDKVGGFQIPELRVVGTGTHMHYVGKDMKIELERTSAQPGEPDRECLIETPQWDFNWQRGYGYDVSIEDAPTFRPGDRLHLRCTYDNSMGNPFVVEALREQGLNEPHDVYLGDETLDEMCLGILMVAYRNPFGR